MPHDGVARTDLLHRLSCPASRSNCSRRQPILGGTAGSLNSGDDSKKLTAAVMCALRPRHNKNDATAGVDETNTAALTTPSNPSDESGAAVMPTVSDYRQIATAQFMKNLRTIVS